MNSKKVKRIRRCRMNDLASFIHFKARNEVKQLNLQANLLAIPQTLQVRYFKIEEILKVKEDSPLSQLLSQVL